MAVLDASAVLALIYRERGYENVPVGGTLSSVNFVEVVARLAGDGEDTQTLEETLALIGIIVKPFTTREAQLAGELRLQTGLSLGDRACLAVASLADEKAITADKAWTKVKLDVEVVLIR